MKAARMAKKKTGPTPRPDLVRSETIAFKCRPDFKEWVSGFADSERDTPSRLIEMALVELAKLRGYEEPPQR